MNLKSILVRSLLTVALLLSVLTTSAQIAQAKGGGSFITAPGQCNVSGATATAVVAKVQNNRQFAIQVVGASSVGTWTVSWTKNNTFVHTSTDTFPPPGGWIWYGLSTAPTDQGVVKFEAVATSTSGVVCSVAISIKI